MSKKKKIKVSVIPIDDWFESKEDAELFAKAHFPNANLTAQQSHGGDVAPTMWIHEAIKYLGLDRTGVKRPDKAIHRLINKGALHPHKISGRLVFHRKELDTVIANGDHKRGRGRPRKL
jgi:hypothetical protein